MTKVNPHDILSQSVQLYSRTEIIEAINKIAADLNRDLSQTTPILLTVLQGAAMFSAHLAAELNFPLQMDSIDVSRYQDKIYGGELNWRVFPKLSLSERVVILVDDILDEGITLSVLKQYCLDQGASKVIIVVLANKSLERPKPIIADYVGLTVPNCYVFGFGMDVHGWWRNLPAINCLKKT